MNMNKKKHENDEPKTDDSTTTSLPPCTSAAAPEQHRSSTDVDDIEPCDDARGTEFEWDKEAKSTKKKKNQSSKENS